LVLEWASGNSVIVSKKNRSRGRKRGGGVCGLHPACSLFLICLALVGLSTLCVGAYRSLLASPLLRVTRIQVTGCERLDRQWVVQQADVHAGANILSLDLSAVSRRLTRVPSVAAAVVMREIPDRIRIDIQERKPIALVYSDGFYLVDGDGVCFGRPVPGEHPGMPIITGMDSESLSPGSRLPAELVGCLRELHRQCRPQLPWRLISEIRWNGDGGLSLYTVRDGIRIDLGSDHYGPRIARLGTVLRYLGESRVHRQLRRVDLTYEDRVFVRGDFRVSGGTDLSKGGV
jgi:cell division protein FtsQ